MELERLGFCFRTAQAQQKPSWLWVLRGGKEVVSSEYRHCVHFRHRSLGANSLGVLNSPEGSG